MEPILSVGRCLLFRVESIIATIVDGQKAWEQVCGEIRRTLDDPLRGLPLVAGFVVVMLVIWANVRVARWLVGPAKHAPAAGDHENT